MKMIAEHMEERMTSLSLFGLFAVTVMVVSYALEARHNAFILVFAVSCVLASAYGFLQGAWPFGIVEAIWSAVAARRWWKTIHSPIAAAPARMNAAEDIERQL